MKKLIPIGFFLILNLLMVGCSQEVMAPEVIVESATLEGAMVDVFVEQEVMLSTYEPEEGTYLGAYVEGNKAIDGKIQSFEDIVGHDQAFRVFQYTGLGDISEIDLLHCIADKKVPYIKLLPTATYDITPVYELIGDLRSSYNTPIFIELLPVTGSVSDPVAYIEHYTEAYKLIKKYVNDVVVVWSIDAERVYETPLYYPGNHLTDWVGLNVYMPKYKEGKPYEVNLKQQFDFWYKNFQEEKPMMLSTLAISHFSRTDHTYTIEDAKTKFTFVYDTLVSEYPRLKGILYADVDMNQMVSDGLDDYRITSQKALSEAVGTLQASPQYLHKVTKRESESAMQQIRYTVPALITDDKYYIDEMHANYVFEKPELKNIAYIEDELGTKYYDLEVLLEKNHGEYVR